MVVKGAGQSHPMLPKQLGEIDRQEEMSEPGFKAMLRGFRRLGVEYSGAENALYDENDHVRILVGMSGGKCYAQVSVDRARRAEKERKNEKDRARIPSPQWALGKIRETGDKGAESRCRNMVRDSVRAAKAAGMLRGRIVVAIDSNLQEFYGDTKDVDEDEDSNTVPMTVRSRSKNGTNDFIGHIAMQGIGPQAKVFLGARHLKPGERIPDKVASLLRELPRLRLSTLLALLDRGHFSVMNMQVLDYAGHWFLMPAIKNSRIKDIIRAQAGRKGPVVVDYTMRSKEDGEFTCRLIICRKAGYTGSDPVEGHVVFATNMTRHICLKYFDMIPDEYKARWEIETGFRCVEAAQGMTRSQYLVVRLALFFFALLLYNAWTISRFLETDGGDPGLWTRCITMEQFSSSVMSLFRPFLCHDKSADGGGGG